MLDGIKSVPPGVLRVQIDNPADLRLTATTGEIRGWFAVRDADLTDTYRFQIGTIPIAHQHLKREDVEAMLPNHAVAGFLLRYDLSLYLQHIDGEDLVIRLSLPDFRVRSLRFKIDEIALASCLATAGD